MCAREFSRLTTAEAYRCSDDVPAESSIGWWLRAFHVCPGEEVLVPSGWRLRACVRACVQLKQENAENAMNTATDYFCWWLGFGAAAASLR